MLNLELTKEYTKPVIISHSVIQFETAHSWNPGCGKNGKKNGNNGVNWPASNPNPTPDGAGHKGKGKGNIGECKNDKFD